MTDQPNDATSSSHDALADEPIPEPAAGPAAADDGWDAGAADAGSPAMRAPRPGSGSASSRS